MSTPPATPETDGPGPPLPDTLPETLADTLPETMAETLAETMAETMAGTLERLEATIAHRRQADPETSYVARLFAKGLGPIAQKLGEEGVETVIAALSESREALVGEAADLLFHLAVVLAARDIRFADVLAELDRREGVSGLAEKASRAAKAGRKG